MGTGTVEGIELKPFETSTYDRIEDFCSWLVESEWKGEYAQAYLNFAARFQDLTGISLSESLVALTDEEFGHANQVLLEQFVTETTKRGNPIDDFLRTCGSTVSDSLSGYLKDLRHSSRSVYEVLSPRGATVVTIKDCLSPTAPLEVEVFDSSKFERGKFILGRMLEASGRRILTSATFEVPSFTVALVSASDNSEEVFDTVLGAWIMMHAVNVTNLIPQWEQSLENIFEPLELAFPVRASRAEIQSQLDRAPDFRKCCESGWRWTPDFKQRNPLEKAKVHYSAEYLVAETDSKKQLKAIKARLSTVLGRKVGKPILADRKFFESLGAKSERLGEDDRMPTLPQIQAPQTVIPETAELVHRPALTGPRQLQLQLEFS